MLLNFEDVKQQLYRILIAHGFNDDRASLCAEIFAANSRDGVHSHGLNRFPVFIDYLNKGWINANAEPAVLETSGALEKWDGYLAPGVYTATKATDRAIALAKEHGLGCVAVRNSNHWMRGGTYGWQAADKNCIALCGTNSIANMPPHGGTEPRLGNNPLVIAVPRREGHVVLDMAMSQFSYGKLNEYKMNGEKLPVPGGYNKQGEISVDPVEIIDSQRTLPIGYWKGSGLSLMMDILVAVLSGGRSVEQITAQGHETGVSHFFLCIDAGRLQLDIINNIIAYAQSSPAGDGRTRVRYPGEQTLRQRKKSMEEGIEVNDQVWEKILKL